MRLKFITPMFPILVEEPPEGDDWIHEINTMAIGPSSSSTGGIRAFSRRGTDWSDKYAPIVEAAASLPTKSAIIDGEMIAPNVSGAPGLFNISKIKRRPSKLAFVAVDLMHRDDKKMRPLPEIELRELLWKLVAPAQGAIQFSQCEVAAYHTASPGLFVPFDLLGVNWRTRHAPASTRGRKEAGACADG